MAKATVVKKNTSGTIAQNKRARHDYFIEEKFEAVRAIFVYFIHAGA